MQKHSADFQVMSPMAILGFNFYDTILEYVYASSIKLRQQLYSLLTFRSRMILHLNVGFSDACKYEQ